MPISFPPPSEPASAACERCGSALGPGGFCRACILGNILNLDAAMRPEAVPPPRVGDYELLEELARGGMGVVWRARQRRLQREVALKFVLEGVLPGETAARRFRQEAEVAAQLSHPHIITVYEVGEADGRYFISMELASGGTLAARLRRDQFTARGAAVLTVKLARAVEHAHDRGVLHRDLKPGNVLFDTSGEPRISDFGLARLTTDRSALTLTGAVMGTPSYMSPGQARGESSGLTTAADIYGLGAILYELLAGRPAFAGEVPVEVLRRVLDEDPPALTSVNRDLDTICQKCLRKGAEQRYRSAGALADDLDRWLRGESIHARRISPAERLVKWVRRRPLLAALTLALTAAVIVIAGLIVTSRVGLARARGAAEASATESRHRRADQHTTAAILAIERGDSLRALPSLAAAIRIGTGDPVRDRVNRIRFGTILRQAPVLEQTWFPDSADDVQIMEDPGAVLICESRRARLLRMDDGTDAVPPLDPGDVVQHAALHAALRRILVQTEWGGTSVWDAATGACLHRLTGKFLNSPRPFAGGGERLALWDEKSVQRYSVREQGYDSPPLPHPAVVDWAWLCQDGRRVVTCAGDRRLRVWDTASGRAVGDPIPCRDGTRLLMEHPDSRTVEVIARDEPAVTIDTERGALIPNALAAGDIRAALDTAGHAIFARSTREGFVISEAKEGNVMVTATHGAQGNDAAFSGNGDRVFTRAVDSGGRLWSLGGRALTPFLWQGADPRGIALDGTGDRIAVSSRGPEVRLWHLRTLNGAVSASRLTSSEMSREWLRYQAYSQSRLRQSFFQSPGTNGKPSLLCLPPDDATLHVQDAAGGQDVIPPLVHPARVMGAIVSPDGQKIASFTASQCIYLWDAATGAQIGPLLRHDREIDSLSFSPDSALVFVTGAHTLRVWESATGMVAAPPMLHPSPVYRASWNDDSTAIATIDKKGQRLEWNLAPDARSSEDLETVARLYSSHRVTTGGALAPLSLEESRAAWNAAGGKTATP